MFAAARRRNWQTLRNLLDPLSEWLEFQVPTHATGWTRDGFAWDSSGHRSDPSWFGFMIRVRPGGPVMRRQLAIALDDAKIGNRMLFGGNLLRQPAFLTAWKTDGIPMRIVGDLRGADSIMNDALFVGVYPGLDDRALHHIADVVTKLYRGTLA